MSSDALCRALKKAAFAPAEPLWSLCFALVRLGMRPQPERWASSGGQRVLVVAPHPDDEAIGCAGTLLRHIQAGDEVRVAVVTDGRGSRALGLTSEEMAQRRRAEAETSVQTLGARLEWFGLPEGEWQLEQLEAQLHTLIQAWLPHCIYAPSRIDFHPEHFKVAQGLARVLDQIHSVSTIRVYPVQVPLTPILTNLVAETATVKKETLAVLNAYRTQQVNVPRALRQRRYAAHLYGLKGWAEEFWQMSPQQYVSLHADNVSLSNFRSLRANPWTDPLAYLEGFSHRKAALRLEPAIMEKVAATP
jgi:LmbE family N-acetylglucosaminyl deacetylase